MVVVAGGTVDAVVGGLAYEVDPEGRILEQLGRRLHGELVPPPAMEESGSGGRPGVVALAAACG